MARTDRPSGVVPYRKILAHSPRSLAIPIRQCTYSRPLVSGMTAPDPAFPPVVHRRAPLTTTVLDGGKRDPIR